MGRMVKSFFLIVVIICTFSSCMKTEHVNPIEINSYAKEIMECIKNKDKDGVFAFFNQYVKENRAEQTMAEIEQFFNYIDGDIVSFRYAGRGGGQERIKEGKIYLFTCYPKFKKITTNNNKEYTIEISYIHTYKDYPEHEGVNRIMIYESDDSSNWIYAGMFTDID